MIKTLFLLAAFSASAQAGQELVAGYECAKSIEHYSHGLSVFAEQTGHVPILLVPSNNVKVKDFYAFTRSMAYKFKLPDGAHASSQVEDEYLLSLPIPAERQQIDLKLTVSKSTNSFDVGSFATSAPEESKFITPKGKPLLNPAVSEVLLNDLKTRIPTIYQLYVKTRYDSSKDNRSEYISALASCENIPELVTLIATEKAKFGTNQSPSKLPPSNSAQ